MRTFLAPAQLALTVIILVWDIVLAGRIAQNRRAPRPFQAVSGLLALLTLPGVLVMLATSTIITGRAVAAVDWIWPAVLVLFAVQAIYAFLARLVNPLWGFPILVYDVIIALAGLTRYAVAHGASPARPAILLLAGQSLAMVVAGGTPGVIASPLYFNVPMISPAFPALRRLTGAFRFLMSALALVWIVLILPIGSLHAVTQLGAYDVHAGDQLRERPNADFAIGVKILPDVRTPPPPPAIRSDSALLDTMDVDAVEVVVVPGATGAALDSLAHVLAPWRADSMTIIVAIGYAGTFAPELRRGALDPARRLATIDQVMRRIHPNILLPAEDPYGSGQRALGALSPQTWEEYLADAAHAAKRLQPSVRIGVAASSYVPNDSALYAWAAARGSPIDIVGFSLMPSPYTGGGIQSDTRTADRWMSVTPPAKPQWVFATGGYPLAYGEKSQQDAIWEVLAWATDHPMIRGAVVFEAGDYGEARGLRAPSGRLRPAASTVMRALRMIRESAR